MLRVIFVTYDELLTHLKSYIEILELSRMSKPVAVQPETANEVKSITDETTEGAPLVQRLFERLLVPDVDVKSFSTA
jgi:hypothetical protein